MDTYLTYVRERTKSKVNKKRYAYSFATFPSITTTSASLDNELLLPTPAAVVDEDNTGWGWCLYGFPEGSSKASGVEATFILKTVPITP
jgi:hypothetical protein